MRKQKGLRLRMGKIYLSFLMVLLMCALTLHGVYMVNFYHSQVEQARVEREYLLSQTVYHTERYVAEIEDCANILCVSPRLQPVLVNRQKPDYLIFANCRDLLAEYETAPYGIYRLDLYVDSSSTLITSSEGVFYDLNEESRAIYQHLMEQVREAGHVWTLDYQEHEPGLISKIRGGQYITLVKRVDSLYTGKTKGLLLLSIPYVEFENVSAAPAEDEYSSLSFAGQTVCGMRKEDDGWTRLTAVSEKTGFTLDYYYRFNFQLSFGSGFLMVLGMIMLLFLLGFVLIVMIAERRVGKPVERLLRGFECMEEGKFSTRVGSHEDAIFGDLNRGFDHMAEHLQTTVTELVDVRMQGRELKQRMLMMQIKPHFLYNIFNNMIWLAEQKKYDNLKQLVTATAGFYKTALNAGAKDIMLFENQRQLEYYVCIQKFRFGDRFDLLTELGEDTEMLLFPNLLLQPLVENAITHGFQGLQRRGEIRLTSRIDGDQLVVRVRDNGMGIGAEQLEKIRDAMRGDSASSKQFFALVNVAARLRNRYGSAASIDIKSVRGEGTEVTIHLPLEEQ